MIRTAVLFIAALSISVPGIAFAQPDHAPFQRLKYNNPGLVVDLGVGLWAQPLPMDYDGDGDHDLVVATADVPLNGIYFFENPGGGDPNPVFLPGIHIAPGARNLSISHVSGEVRLTTPGTWHRAFQSAALDQRQKIDLNFDPAFERTRADQWKYVDFDGDGALDLAIGLGVWDDYGWDDAYDAHGNWTNGPLHGYVYIARNTGTNDSPAYAEPEVLMAASGPVDVFGAPSPNFADWDNDGDLDLICGSFLDTITWFENTGTRKAPVYADGHELKVNGETLHIELEMLQVTALDWDKDGDTDLVVGEEDGRVSWLECTGTAPDGMPTFKAPQYFRQQAEYVKVGALVTPFSCDWDGDGDEDLIAGDTAGFLNFVENLDGAAQPKWAAPVRLKAAGETIRIQAGENRSIQGPAEAKWGYTVPCVADWNHDGLLDIIINSISGQILWYENTGQPGLPKLAGAKTMHVLWSGKPAKPSWVWWKPKPEELVTQWRTSPMVNDIDGDGLNDLVVLDHEGYLALFQRVRIEDDQQLLTPGQRIFKDDAGYPLRLNDRDAGKSGRRKLALVDWDGDGDLDLLANSVNIDLYRNVAETKGEFVFRHEGPLADSKLAGHTTCPTVVDWNRDGIPDLLSGAEDGLLYYLKNPRS